MKRLSWIGRTGLFLAALTLFACGQTPATTEQARGLLTGIPVVLAMSAIVLIVGVGLIAGVVGIDRFDRNRRRLADGPPPEPEGEEEAEVVAGITVGRAGVPRWLYGFYVLIPVFAFAYVFTSVSFVPEGGTEPGATEAPAGPCTECEIAAAQIAFDKDLIQVPAETDVTVTFNNNDTGVPHNFKVWEDEAAAQSADTGAQIAATDNINGGASAEAEFNSGPPGEYYFNCDIHPASMFGSVEVAAG